MTWAFLSNVPTVPRSSITNYADEQIVETLSLWLHSGGVVFIKLRMSWIIIRYRPKYIVPFSLSLLHLFLSLLLTTFTICLFISSLWAIFFFFFFFCYRQEISLKGKESERSLKSLAAEVSLPSSRCDRAACWIQEVLFLAKKSLGCGVVCQTKQ